MLALDEVHALGGIDRCAPRTDPPSYGDDAANEDANDDPNRNAPSYSVTNRHQHGNALMDPCNEGDFLKPGLLQTLMEKMERSGLLRSSSGDEACEGAPSPQRDQDCTRSPFSIKSMRLHDETGCC